MDRPEFQQKLKEAARSLDATVREGPGDAWTVSGGTPACANANAAPWKAVVTLAGDAWGLSPVPVSLPWNRRRAAAIAAHRARQLDELLRNPRATEPHERFPFCAGPALSDRLGAFSWTVAAGALAMALTLAAVTLATIPIIERELAELRGRADVLARIGADPLPRVSEMENLGWIGRIAAAFLLATPVAFFLGGLYALVTLLGERFVNVGRFAPWCLTFIGASSLLALAPRMPLPAALVGAIVITTAAFLGPSLLWGRRRDAIVGGPRPKLHWRPATGAAILIAVGVLAALTPGPRSNEDRVRETSRFRDRFLLDHAAGRALAHFYYRYTLFAAEPVRPPYSSDPEIKDRQVRTALLIGKFGMDIEQLRALGFHVERAADPDKATALIEKKQHDVYIVGQSLTRPFAPLAENGLLERTLRQGMDEVAGAPGVRAFSAPAQPEEIEKALDAVFRIGGLESMLLELTWLGWTSIFYGGPLFALLLTALPFAASIAWLTRNRSERAARISVASVFLLAVAGLLVVLGARWGAMRRVGELQRLPADDQAVIDILDKALRDPDEAVRYEAAYQAYLALARPSFPRGGLKEALRRAARDESVRVRLRAAPALGLTRDPSVRPDIFAAMDDPDVLVRYRAAEGLEHLDAGRQPVPPETIRKLREMIKTRSWYEGMYALAALRKIEPLRH